MEKHNFKLTPEIKSQISNIAAKLPTIIDTTVKEDKTFANVLLELLRKHSSLRFEIENGEEEHVYNLSIAYMQTGQSGIRCYVDFINHLKDKVNNQ